jgi:hypothetical protein
MVDRVISARVRKGERPPTIAPSLGHMPFHQRDLSSAERRSTFVTTKGCPEGLHAAIWPPIKSTIL